MNKLFVSLICVLFFILPIVSSAEPVSIKKRRGVVDLTDSSRLIVPGRLKKRALICLKSKKGKLRVGRIRKIVGSSLYWKSLRKSDSSKLAKKQAKRKKIKRVKRKCREKDGGGDSPQALTARDQSVSTEEGTPKSITLVATGGVGTLSFEIVSMPSNGQLSGTPPQVVYTPEADFVGTDAFTFRASDENTSSNIATVTCRVRSTFVEPVQNYSRYLNDPFDKFSYSSIQAMVDAIKAEGYPVPTGHPRIFINPSNIDSLRSKIAGDTELREWMQEMVDLADTNYGVEITDPGGHSDEPDAQPVVMADGIIYQLGEIEGITYQHTPQEYGQDGVRHLLSLANLGRPPYGSNYVHREYLGLPLGYDWLYDLLTEQQRQTVAAKLLLNADPNNTEEVSPYNNPPGARLLGALAVAGDGIDDAEAERLLNLFHNGLVFGDVIGNPFHYNSTVDQIFVSEGPGIEGLGYSGWYNPFYPILLAWRDQTGEDYFKLPFFQNWVFHMTHLSGNEYEHADKYSREDNESWVGGFHPVNTMLELGLAPSNPAAAALSKYHRKRRNASASVRMLYLLLADTTIEAKSPAELGLPTTAHFECANNIFARNLWEGIESTWVWFQSPTWTNVRDLGPLNDLLIWKHGGMLLGKHEQSHDYDGGNRTNTVVLYDQNQPGKTFIPKNVMDRSSNRGLGLRFSQGASLNDLNRNLNGYNKGLRFFEEQEGQYIYALGDSGGVYQALGDEGGCCGDESVNLQSWRREFVWFREGSNDAVDVIIVFDSFEKESQTVTAQIPLHFNLNPQIRNRHTNADVGQGDKQFEGVWKYESAGADRIVVTNNVVTDWGQAHGRLFIDTLLPKSVVYYRMGGIGTRNVDIFGNLREKKLPQSLIDGSADDPGNILMGMWRVQIAQAGQESGQKQIFLNVMQAAEESLESPDGAVLLEGQNMTGAAVGSNLVLFNLSESTLSTGTLTVPSGVSGIYRILVTGLEPGSSYGVVAGSSNTSLSATNQGTLFLKDVSLQVGDRIEVTAN